MNSKQSPEAMKIEPALLTIPQVCLYLNVQRATFYNLKASGKFGPLPVNLCRKVLYVRSEVESWVQAGLPHRKLWQPMKKEWSKKTGKGFS